METLSGSVERITFYNLENGYTVLRLHMERLRGMHDAVPKDGLATVADNLPRSHPGSKTCAK